MVRKKQIFSVDVQTPSSTPPTFSDVRPVLNTGFNEPIRKNHLPGSKLPKKKAVERMPTNLLCLDEVDDDFFRQSTSQSAMRKNKERNERTVEKTELEKHLNRQRMATKRNQMTVEEIALERNLNKERMTAKRNQMTVEEIELERNLNKERMTTKRNQMTVEEIEFERILNKEKMTAKRNQMPVEEMVLEREMSKVRMASKRSEMSLEEIENEKISNSVSHVFSRKRERNLDGLYYLAAADPKKAILYLLGDFNFKCTKCDSLHFPEEKSVVKDCIFFSCCKGGRLLNLLECVSKYPEEMKALFFEENPFYSNFITNIRRYNSMFACASISCFRFKFQSPGPPCYKIQGQIYHKFNQNAMPKDNEIPTNGQLYFIDSEEAIDIRSENNKECRPEIIEFLETFLRKINPFAQSFLMMKEVYEKEENNCKKNGLKMPNINLVFSLKENYDKRRYNIPRCNEVGAIVVCDANDEILPARIVVYPKGEKQLKNIYPLDKCVDQMCYPLLYPMSSEGFNVNIKDLNGKKISLCDYTKFLLFFRENGIFFPHFYAKKLFQQWLVDQAAKIEWDRLEYIRTHQMELCSSNYLNVEDFLKNRASKTGAEIKKKVILPSTFTGGPRSMHENFMDALAIVNETGKPDLFITFTCNPNDYDILKCLLPTQTPSDRPDLVSRVFHLKKNHFLDLIFNKQIFGEVIGDCWVIEYQKRGLPHLHLLITLHPKNKWHTINDIDNFISAEIPDEKNDPELYKIITNCMMHGPCNEKSPCWNEKKRKCNKKFPKPFNENTKITEDGYPLYKRPDNGRCVYKKGKMLSNQFVVPYNPFLCKTFNAHINVERVTDITVVKYLYDYIYKGYDAATIECVRTDENGVKKILEYDEVTKYLEARYISPCEACWRIFKYPMQGKSHSVDILDVHLENMQRVVYKKGATTDEIEEAALKETTLTAYFKFCQENPNLVIKYTDMPKYCTWLKRERKWKFPRQGNQKKIGRIIPINPTDTEKYYLRFLLLNVYGKSPKDLRTVNGIEYATYAEACLARGLTRDDEEWDKCMEEATFFSRKNPKGLRNLFVNILVHCAPKYPEKLWEKYKEYMVQDLKKKFPNKSVEYICEQGLIIINHYLNFHDKTLSDFKKMPQIRNSLITSNEYDIYDPVEELETANRFISLMNNDQKNIIETIKSSIIGNNKQKYFFIDGPGGTGKSFTLKTIYHLAKAYNKNICNMAFSGIAATILKKGRTLHNRFKLPLNVKKNSTSGIESNGKDAEEIIKTDIFIWDEAPMASRFVLDIIDCKLKELMGNNIPFGGKILILSGDFRQCLPIKEFASRTEIIDLVIKNSPLWLNFIKLNLTINMRAEENERDFAQQLIEIGDGTAGENELITVPDDCICEDDLIEEIFGDLIIKKEFDKMGERAILSPLNIVVDEYNENLIKRLPGEYHTYLSIDESDPSKNFPVSPEVLNTFKCPSLPNHKIDLKINSMVMLLRNLDVRQGLCNGTRMQVKEMGKHVISCLIVSGDKTGEIALIPRITLIEDKKFPFILRRHQFPLKPAFAFTINKSQAQTFSKIGIDYTNDPFTHGQTYVAFSRCRSWKGLKIKLANENSEKK